MQGQEMQGQESQEQGSQEQGSQEQGIQEPGAKNEFGVTPAEGGQKLLQFLQRRLALPPTLLHRWVRTGQIRRNGGRCKPFDHVRAGDMVRLPPFALAMNQSAVEDNAARQQRKNEIESAPHPSRSKRTQNPTGHPAPGRPIATTPQSHIPPQVSASHLPPFPQATPPLPPVVYANEHLLVMNKPAGLPVHPGTGHSDSLATRLAQHFSHAPFRPTPAHRLDKDTSGLLLVASSYSTLRALQEAFFHRHMVKEYVAWVHGLWSDTEPVVLRHQLAKQYRGHNEKMCVLSAEVPFAPALLKGSMTPSFGDDTPSAGGSDKPSFGDDTPSASGSMTLSFGDDTPSAGGSDKPSVDGKDAICVVHCLRYEAGPSNETARTTPPHSAPPRFQTSPPQGRSLLHIRLITGRTHQIRAQLAAVGHPLCGDSKYGAPPARHALYLHSLRIILPEVAELAPMPREFAVLPPWQNDLAVQAVPPPLTVPAA